jgi:autotransporter-associated beta strand protein
VILDVADAANAFTVGQVLNQTTGNLVKLGPGTLVLSNTNTYSGTTVIGSAGGPTGGTLRLSGVGRISGTSGTAAPLIYSGTLDTNGINVTTAAFTLGGGAAATTAGVTTGSGTVTLGGNVTFDATNNAGGATIAGNLNLGNANRTFTVGDSTGASNDLTISAAITSGSLTKAGAGTLLLSGSNSYAGTTTGTGGVLQFANKNALYGGTTASWTKTNITVHSGATLAVNVGDSGDLFTDANVATLLTGIGGTVNNNGLRAGSNIGFDTTNATSGTFTLSTVVANTLGTGSGAVGLAKLGAGTLVVQGANTFTGTTFIGTLGGGNAGILRLASTGSISGIATVFGGTLDFDGNSRTLTALNLGGGGAGSAASVLTGAGTLTLNGNAAFDATNNPNGATISGNVSLNNAARTFTVGDSTAAAADLTIDALISGGSASGGLTKAGAGRLVLSNTANSFAGKTAIQAGTVEFSSIANVNGGASNLGAPTTPGNGTIDLGSTTSAGGLRYTGTGHTTDRVINLAGTTGGATIDAAGSGALVLTGANTATGIGNKTFTLSGTSTAANAIGVIAGTGVSVNKTGSGLWRLTGASSYDGQLQVLDGTIVVAAAVGSSGNNSPFGTGNGTIIGSSATGASGTAVLLADGVDITRSFAVASSGSGGSQVVVLGATGTGVAIFGSSGVSIRLGRQVTLQASGSATARFNALWKDGNGNDDPVVGYTIGSAGNAGLVQLESSLSGSATGVSIVNGTAQLFNNNQGGEQIAPATPVTVGSTLGAATLDLNGLSQSLSRLTFAGNSGSVTTGTAAGGMLRLVSSGSVSVSGTGHVISSLVDLVAPTTFDTGSASTLTVSSVISSTSGAIGLTKTGLGTLWLSAANTYSGATQVNAGTFVVNGSLGSGALSVAAGATLMGSGTIGGAATIAGIHSPGNSPGVETFSSNLTYTGSSSQVIWELWNNTVSNSPLAYDQIVVNGNLDFTGATSLVLDFGGTGVGSVDWTDSFWDSNKTWTLFDVAGTTSNLGNFSLTNSPTSWLDANGLAFASSTRKDNSFSVTQQGSDVLLRYTVVVPEPASLALAAIGIAAAAWAARRRQ